MSSGTKSVNTKHGFKVDRLDDMVRGWFVGNFEPTLYQTNDVEVGVKRYRKGDSDRWHYHKIATEITVVIEGRIRMNASEFGAGDAITVYPGQGVEFEALSESVTVVVVKLPGANDDKFYRDDSGPEG